MAGPAHAVVWIIQQPVYVTQPLELISASPAANQSLAEPPRSVTLNFSAAIDPKYSGIKIYDPYGNVIAEGPVTITNTSMSIAMPKLKQGYAGTYRVEWKTICLCGDRQQLNGNLYFNIS